MMSCANLSVNRALDKNEYNHITATYFLLAERKLRAHRQEQVPKTRPELLDVSSRFVFDIIWYSYLLINDTLFYLLTVDKTIFP